MKHIISSFLLLLHLSFVLFAVSVTCTAECNSINTRETLTSYSLAQQSFTSLSFVSFNLHLQSFSFSRYFHITSTLGFWVFPEKDVSCNSLSRPISLFSRMNLSLSLITFACFTGWTIWLTSLLQSFQKKFRSFQDRRKEKREKT